MALRVCIELSPLLLNIQVLARHERGRATVLQLRYTFLFKEHPRIAMHHPRHHGIGCFHDGM